MSGVRPVDAEWETFRRDALPGGLPSYQVREMRRAFYGGALSLLATIMKTLDPGDEPTEADMARMDDIKADLDLFGEEVRRGLK